MAKPKGVSAEEFLKDQGQEFAVKAEDNWYGRELQTKSNPVYDPGVGKPLVIRRFDFVVNPDFKGKLSQQELFNLHWKQISIQLWSDGLVPYEKVQPKVHIGKGKYTIGILAEANSRNAFMDKPKTLQQLMPKTNAKSRPA